MRTFHTAPLAAAILLAACGSDADTDGDGTISAKEATAEVATASVKQRPGQYKVSIEPVDVAAPGISDADKQRFRNVMANRLGEGTFVCLTPEQAADGGVEQMTKDLGARDCTMRKFDVSGNTFTAELQCAQPTPTTVKMDGEITAESTTTTIEASHDVPNVGPTTMTMRVHAERVAACAG